MAVAAAIQVAKRAGPDDIVVVLNPDSGRGYLSRVFDDEWMASFGFLRECDECVGAVLDTRGDTPSCSTSTPSSTVRAGDRAHARQRRQPAPGVQEHAAVRRRRGVGRGRRAGADGGDRPRPVRDGHAGREGDGPEAADDRRRPAGRAGRRDARPAPALLVLSGGRPLPCSPAPTCSVLRGASPTARARADVGEQERRRTTALGLRDPGHPRRPGARPDDRRGRHADHAGHDVRPGRRRRPPRLRVLPQRATPPAPRSRRASRRWRRPATGSRSPAGWPPRTPCCASSPPGERVRARQRRLRRHVPADRQGVRPARACAWTAVDLTDLDALAAELARRHGDGVAGDADQPAAHVRRHRGRGRARPRARRPRRRRQHVRHAVPAAAARARRRHRRALGDQVPRRPQRRRRRVRRRRRRRARRAPALHPERGRRRARAVRLLPRAARREDARPCAWTATAPTPGPSSTCSSATPPSSGCSTRSSPTTPATPPPPSRCATSAAWSASRCAAAARRAERVAAATELFTLAESLGAVESLIEHPGEMTHASVAGSPLEVPDDLVRLSVGIESAADLVADLEQALDAA